MEERTKNKKETFSLFNLFSAPEKNVKQNDLNGRRYAGIGQALGWHLACSAATRFQHMHTESS